MSCDHQLVFTNQILKIVPPRYVYKCVKCGEKKHLKTHISPHECSHIWSSMQHELGPNYEMKKCLSCEKIITRPVKN